jgi:beta-glucanase (GH16 family)
MRYLTGFSLLFLSFLCTSVRAQCPNLVWSDEFDAATLNEADWSFIIGDGCDIGICQWGNNEAQTYQRNNVALEDGLLKITARRESLDGSFYTSGRISSKGKQDFKFGYLEARIKLPVGGGLWPAFWMLSTNEEYGGWPRSGEIDIMEWLGNRPKEVLGTIHYGQAWPNNSFTGHTLKQVFNDFSDSYHTFAVEWSETKVTWLIDGYPFGSKSRSDVVPLLWPFDKEFYFILNVAVGGTLGGAVDNTAFPATMEVDYVRVYDTTPATLVGNREVVAGADETYTIDNLPVGASIIWTVPDGVVITPDPANPGQASINWNGNGGVLTAAISSDCGNYELSTEVSVGPVTGVEYSFENFDDEALAIYEFSSGTLTEIDNPAPNGVNSSVKVGEYVRGGDVQYDVIVYRVNTIENADDYVNAERSITIDMNTTAAPGTELLLQLETATAEGDNYPTGRHSRYRATTTVRNEWERLTFELLDQPDGGATSTAITKLVLLFNPNTFNGDTFHYDNLDSNAPNPNGVFNTAQLDFPLTASPNPATETVQLHYVLPASGPLNISLFNAAGTQVQCLDLQGLAGENRAQLELSTLPAGLYFARLRMKEGIRTVRLMKQ